ncbi:MAG TPA: SIMPL domain-containing protein [Chloroflexota bacterium]|nr:SIMPL domain-containing protein [Chloroflexota bacterium]
MKSDRKTALASVSLAAILALSACQTLAPPAGGARSQTAPQSGQAAPAGAAPAIAPAAPNEAVAAAAPRVAQQSAPSQIVVPPGPVVASPTGITVVGEGMARAEPDVAYVTTGVLTRGQTAKQAQDENTRLMNAIIQAIRGRGVEEKDVRTSGISLYPTYEREPNTISGYQATNTVRVTVQDVKKTGEILDAAVGAGANINSGVQFGLKDDTAFRRQALDQAVKEARAKADAIAGAAGLRVAGVQSMVDESQSQPVAPEMARVAMANQAAAGPVPVQPGQLAVTARVRVVYSFQ